MTTQHAYAPGQLPVWTFADKIRKARDITGATQRDFAEQIGITASSLAAYETGRSAPRFNDAQALAKRLQLATGIPASWFLTVDDPNPAYESAKPQPRDYKAAVSPVIHLADYRNLQASKPQITTPFSQRA